LIGSEPATNLRAQQERLVTKLLRDPDVNTGPAQKILFIGSIAQV